jgi:RHS repeat-associated protein
VRPSRFQKGSSPIAPTPTHRTSGPSGSKILPETPAGLTPASYPPNHDAAFDQNATTRGNVTGVQTFSSISPALSTTRYTKYDIFGNPVNADVSCCQVKNFTFNSSNYWSQPVSVTDGTPGVVPFLTTSYQYDFNTGLVTQTTDPNNLTTSFAYDSAWRLQTVTAPSGAVTTTQPDRDANGNDQLAYSQQVSYLENGSSKVITSKSWFDGGGRLLRSGSGAGTAPTSYDTVATVYDRFGRLLKQSNPYVGDSSGNGSPSYWTLNSYDLLSRVTQVKLPDNQTITTLYEGAAPPTGARVTVTDQVGRQRKSESDGVGRLVKVTEQDPGTGGLSWDTLYNYDVLDNLTGVNQNNQTRSFVYDALSRLTSQTTPEAGAVTFTYKDFGAVQKRTDARGVETHYKYDSLNRPLQVWYTGLGGDDNGSIRPALPSGVTATSDVTIAYNNFSSPQVGNGQVNSVTDGAGSESYGYDSLSRVSSKTRVIDSRSYQTQYLYNTANQLTTLIYPSGKRVRTNHDSRGRTSGLDKVDSFGNVLANYVTSVAYNTASQVTGVNLANGVNETYGYSADRLQLTSQTAVKGANTLMSLTYNYAASAGASGTLTTAGNSGQLMSIGGTINSQSRSQSFTYDNVGRLLTATGWSVWNRRFAYDRWGNRTGMWDAVTGGNQLQNIAIALTGGVANNRIANVNGVSYTYDASGNCTWDGAHSYAYDGEGRQANVDSGVTASSAYDSNNWRVKKVAGGLTTHYVWEGAQVIAEYNGSTGALISEYIFAGSRMVARDQGGVLRYFHQDRLSTRMITDSTGAVVGTEDHLPFGEDAGTTGETEKHRFTSYERDSESGTDQAINRQHQYAKGRFMQGDPIGGSLIYPQTLNRYAYAGNDPINFADPMGLVRENVWSLWAGFSLLGGTNITWDGATVPQYMLGMVAHLWMSGGANIIPPGWELNPKSGKLVNPTLDIKIDNPNDYWRTLPQIFGHGPLWNNAKEGIRGRLDDLIRKVLGNQKCVEWFNRRSSEVGHGADLAALFQKTGFNFYLSGDKVSLEGLKGLNTSKFGVGESFGQTLFGGSGSPQVVINRSAFDSLNNPGIVKELIHEMFHAAGLHGSDPKGTGFLGLFTPNDLNPEVQWSDIKQNCVDNFAY